MDYDVALSFAGEDREYAKQIAKLLKIAHVRVFYDTFEQAALWGDDLYTHLADVYSNRARYCVILISEHYVRKSWTRHERRFAQARALRADVPYILPIRLDDTELPGLPETVAFVDLRRTSVESVVRLVLEKLAGSEPEANVQAGSIGSRAYAAAILARYDDDRLGMSLPLAVAAGGEDSRTDALEYIDRSLVVGTRDLLIILGGYGTGKTTLCKQVLVHYCKRLLDGAQPTIVPIYVDLRNSTLTFGTDENFADILNEYRSIAPDVSDVEWLVLLDGYDEIGRDRHSLSIATLVNKGFAGRRVKVVLTSRTHFFQTELDAVTRLAAAARIGSGLVDMRQAVANVRDSMIHLLEFEDGDVRHYLNDRFASDSAAYYDKLLRIYDLNDLSRRPILLELISSVLPDLDESDFISAASLYETAVALWLQREAWRGVRSAAVISFMKALATQMFLDDRLEMNFEDLTGHVRAQFEREILSFVDLERFDELIRTSTFISRDADGNFSFMHRSFMEYFFAEAMIDKINQGTLALSSQVGGSPAAPFLSESKRRRPFWPAPDAAEKAAPTPAERAMVLGEGIIELLEGALRNKYPDHVITYQVSKFTREKAEFREKERRVNRIASSMRRYEPVPDDDSLGPLPRISMIGGQGRIYYDVEHREFLLVTKNPLLRTDWTLMLNLWTTWIHT